MEKETTAALFRFIKNSPSAAHTIDSATSILEEQGFEEIFETEKWSLKPGGKYYFVRGMRSLTAFCYPSADFEAYSVIAPHGDSPCFRVKESPEMRVENHYTTLNTEVYGGLPLHLWLDRPLGIAGMVMVKDGKSIRTRLLDLRKHRFVIPSLAIHQNRAVNDGFKLNPQTQILPLFGGGKADFKALLAKELGVEKGNILAHEMYLYNAEEPMLYGAEEEFAASPKLDDLQCVFAGLQAFVTTTNPKNVTVFTIFDNEEIGSMTRRGADSDILSSLLSRIAFAAGKTREEQAAAIAASFMLSADNGHAAHPLYPEKSDPTNRCYLNGGVLIKTNARYATDLISAAVFREICENAEVSVQQFFNRSDVSGGSTLGNISATHVSMNCVDIGAPQLSMHSPYETTGTSDTLSLIKAMREFYGSTVFWQGSKGFTVQKAPPAERWTDISSNESYQ
ncbi:M18 family aminopeptidase [Scatolibacter rhodanostii]|uniref:M18 family aminopeptidase n=1 Tax=Scatolibacter rhodanostii TaxID=2014781 RepID=UPI000C06A36C|nr:M18 family aminopeptidase [Scatolibacter rhodanostii]